jgi:hypothetical protein
VPTDDGSRSRSRSRDAEESVYTEYVGSFAAV